MVREEIRSQPFTHALLLTVVRGLPPQQLEGGIVSTRLDAVLAEILPWARATFPQATPYSIAKHLEREAVELAKRPTSPGEMADVGILLYELAAAVGVDLPTAMAEKHAENLRRDWGIPDADGVVEHIRTRPTWDEHWFDAARQAAQMATCPRASIGAVLVKEKRSISAGFNGAPSGEPHCPRDAEHLALDHCTIAVHAEFNALKNALVPAFGATLYVVGPRRVCPSCADHLHRAGVGDIRWSAS